MEVEMKKFFLYGHNGSGNHGCEAIVRSTCKILREGFGDIDITLALEILVKIENM